MVFGTSQESPTASMDVTRVRVYIPHTTQKTPPKLPDTHSLSVEDWRHGRLEPYSLHSVNIGPPSLEPEVFVDGRRVFHPHAIKVVSALGFQTPQPNAVFQFQRLGDAVVANFQSSVRRVTVDARVAGRRKRGCAFHAVCTCLWLFH